MAKEFPNVDWTVSHTVISLIPPLEHRSNSCIFQAIDLFPFQSNIDLPENLQYCQDDAATGISYPDNYFDVFHARALLAGVALVSDQSPVTVLDDVSQIRDWRALVQEAIRVVRPGGLVVLAELGDSSYVYDLSVEEAWQVAPGISQWAEYIRR